MKNVILKYTPKCGMNETKYDCDESAWVLLDTMATLPIIALLVFAASMLLMSSWTALERMSIYAEEQFYARIAADKMIQDIKQSSSMEILNNGSILKLRDGDGMYISYYVNRQQIIRLAGGSGIPLSENTSSIEFTSISSDAVMININLSKDGVEYRLSITCARMK